MFNEETPASLCAKVAHSYRLGAFGFMTSEELRAAGFKANSGFHDQKAALEWVKKFIGGFGGDPDEITVVGESAGGCKLFFRLVKTHSQSTVAVTMFLTSEQPLMKRCLSTGGAVLLFKPIPLEVAESAYQSIIQALGLADKSPEDRIKALLTIPADDLWQKVPMGTPLIPSIDGETVPGAPGFSIVSSQHHDSAFPLPGRKWCSALMIGESKLDVSVPPPRLSCLTELKI